jgi:hypothetical protein
VLSHVYITIYVNHNSTHLNLIKWIKFFNFNMLILLWVRVKFSDRIKKLIALV